MIIFTIGLVLALPALMLTLLLRRLRAHEEQKAQHLAIKVRQRYDAAMSVYPPRK